MIDAWLLWEICLLSWGSGFSFILYSIWLAKLILGIADSKTAPFVMLPCLCNMLIHFFLASCFYWVEILFFVLMCVQLGNTYQILTLCSASRRPHFFDVWRFLRFLRSQHHCKRQRSTRGGGQSTRLRAEEDAHGGAWRRTTHVAAGGGARGSGQ